MPEYGGIFGIHYLFILLIYLIQRRFLMRTGKVQEELMLLLTQSCQDIKMKRN